jgi:hypothetical protein
MDGPVELGKQWPLLEYRVEKPRQVEAEFRWKVRAFITNLEHDIMSAASMDT